MRKKLVIFKLLPWLPNYVLHIFKAHTHVTTLRNGLDFDFPLSNQNNDPVNEDGQRDADGNGQFPNFMLGEGDYI